MLTEREQIKELLKKEKYSIQQLANMFRVEVHRIEEDLQHIEKSIKPKKLKRDPAFCKHCGFVFRERSKINVPSRCPKCKSEWVQGAVYWIE
ncbi:transcriptional regulator [Candidatus Woesearchaeota archaeon]|nr:transcriptional regulator [Candidatus Woesearchaeota archaeon]